MSVSVLALSVAGFWKPSWPWSSVSSPSFSFHCLQATWQARQPMHFVMSISVVLMAGEDGGRAHAFLAFEAAPGAALTTFTRQAFVSWVPRTGIRSRRS